MIVIQLATEGLCTERGALTESFVIGFRFYGILNSVQIQIICISCRLADRRLRIVLATVSVWCSF